MTFKDYVSNVLGDSSQAKLKVNMTLEYTDGSVFEAYAFDCSTQCVDGNFNGKIDLLNARSDAVKVLSNFILS